MQSSEKRQKAVDLSHHLSDVARARATSPLKGLARYFGRPGLITLAGGTPSPDYFPFAAISGDALVPESFSVTNSQSESSLSWLWKIFGGARKEKTNTITIPKFTDHPQEEVNLATALQYGTATGLPQLQKFINNFVEKVYQPAYADWTTLVQTGNTDGWSRVVNTLCNPGEAFITEDWTYPSALASSQPYGVHPVGVPMDNEGMRSDELRKLLSEWDETARGCKRPHVMYTIPVGQNPTGVTMGVDRKKEIYDICVEYDIIIVEDDPYYFLQMGPYVEKSERATPASALDSDKWIAGLQPTYVKLDYQGRVIRLDTFSKTIAPGSRLGFFTCNPRFAERLERAGETSTQAPCGFGQSLITQLLTSWKFEGYTRWLHGLAAQYKARRDYLLDALSDEFHLKVSFGASGSWKGCTIYTATAKPRRGALMTEKFALGAGDKPYFSVVPPSAGMFVWLKMHYENVPGFRQGDEDTLEMKLWTKLAEAGVLIGPGRYFNSDEESVSPAECHFRISFSFATDEELKKAVEIFGKVVREFFEEAQ
ncbi:PLP-dependent transferase [Cubamyces sp. BRFM 1775]|nr:PLP-dependent transferase [Cubamyces sp. BRFM 1775]